MRCRHCRQKILTRRLTDTGRIDVCITCQILSKGRTDKNQLNVNAYASDLAEIHQAIDEGTACQEDEQVFWDMHRADMAPEEHSAVMVIAYGAAQCAQCGRYCIDADRYVEHGEFFCEYEGQGRDSCEEKWLRDQEYEALSDKAGR